MAEILKKLEKVDSKDEKITPKEEKILTDVQKTIQDNPEAVEDAIVALSEEEQNKSIADVLSHLTASIDDKNMTDEVRNAIIFIVDFLENFGIDAAVQTDLAQAKTPEKTTAKVDTKETNEAKDKAKEDIDAQREDMEKFPEQLVGKILSDDWIKQPVNVRRNQMVTLVWKNEQAFNLLMSKADEAEGKDPVDQKTLDQTKAFMGDYYLQMKGEALPNFHHMTVAEDIDKDGNRTGEKVMVYVDHEGNMKDQLYNKLWFGEPKPEDKPTWAKEADASGNALKNAHEGTKGLRGKMTWNEALDGLMAKLETFGAIFAKAKMALGFDVTDKQMEMIAKYDKIAMEKGIEAEHRDKFTQISAEPGLFEYFTAATGSKPEKMNAMLAGTTVQALRERAVSEISSGYSAENLKTMQATAADAGYKDFARFMMENNKASRNQAYNSYVAKMKAGETQTVSTETTKETKTETKEVTKYTDLTKTFDALKLGDDVDGSLEVKNPGGDTYMKINGVAVALTPNKEGKLEGTYFYNSPEGSEKEDQMITVSYDKDAKSYAINPAVARPGLEGTPFTDKTETKIYKEALVQHAMASSPKQFANTEHADKYDALMVDLQKKVGEATTNGQLNTLVTEFKEKTIKPLHEKQGVTKDDKELIDASNALADSLAARIAHKEGEQAPIENQVVANVEKKKEESDG